MGNQSLELQTDEPEATYKVISFPGARLPETYRPLVFSRFLRALRFGNEYFRLIDQDPYFKLYHQYIETLLARPDTLVKFAVLSDNHDIVLGYAITEPGKLHWVHVQRDYRRSGIGESLLSEPFDSFSHITNVWISIWNKKYRNARFNPWA